MDPILAVAVTSFLIGAVVHVVKTAARDRWPTLRAKRYDRLWPLLNLALAFAAAAPLGWMPGATYLARLPAALGASGLAFAGHSTFKPRSDE